MVWTYFGRPQPWHTIKTNFIIFQAVDLEIYSILKKRVWDYLFRQLLCMNFQEKIFSFYILLTDRISFSVYLKSIHIIIMFGPACDVINFKINVCFVIKPFFYIAKNSGQICKYLKDEKSLYHEINSISHHFERAFIEANTNNCFVMWEPEFKFSKKS